jgi:hypothetical protein
MSSTCSSNGQHDAAVTDQPLLIIADNHRAAWNYAREHDLGPERRAWRYVSHVRDVQGLKPGTYVTLSTGEATGKDLEERIEVGQYLRAVGFTYRPAVSSAATTDRPT